MAPWADILYACDGAWWDRYFEEASSVFRGELWTIDKRAHISYGVHFVDGDDRKGLGRDKVFYGSNGGYQAINLVYLFGASRIVLLGFDMQKTGGKSHWHGDHPGDLNRDCPVRHFAKNFPALASDLAGVGVEVINATRETALECFPKKRLEDALSC
jgi:hypothetical protein